MARIPRRKVHIAYIASESARRATYKKRTKGFLKKMNEISVLCGIDACAVIYSPFEASPVVWPDMERARSVVTEFRKMPEMYQRWKMYDQESYLEERVSKSMPQLERLQRENREKEVALMMYGCASGRIRLDGLSKVDLNDIWWMIDKKVKEINFLLAKGVDAGQQALPVEGNMLGYGGAGGSSGAGGSGGAGGGGDAGDIVPPGGSSGALIAD